MSSIVKVSIVTESDKGVKNTIPCVEAGTSKGGMSLWAPAPGNSDFQPYSKLYSTTRTGTPKTAKGARKGKAHKGAPATAPATLTLAQVQALITKALVPAK